MNEGGRKIARNAAVLTGTEILARVMSLVLIMAVARRLGPELLGVYAFAAALIGLLGVFTNFGLEPYIQREVGRRPDSAGSLFDRVFSLKLALYALCLIAAVALSFILAEPGLKRQVIWILAVSLFFTTNMTGTNAFFRGLEKAHYEAAVRLSSRLFYTSAGLVALLSGLGLLALVSLELAASAGACFAAWRLFAKKAARPFSSIGVKGLMELVRAAKEFFYLRVVQTVFNLIDLVMLSLMTGDTATGLYSATVRLVGAFGFLPGALTGAFLPALSRRGGEGDDDPGFAEVFRPYFKNLLILGVGLAAGLAGSAQAIMVFLFGPSFAPAGTTLAVMALALLITFANWSLSNAIIALDMERRMVRLFAAAAGFNIAANLIAIPLWRYNGAAWATAASQALLLALQLNCLGRDLVSGLGLVRLSARPLLAGGAALTSALLLAGTGVNLFLGLLAAGLVYLAGLMVTGALRPREIAALAGALKPSRGRP